MAQAPTQQQISPAQQNALARQAVLAQAVEMTQSIFTITVNPANQNILNIPPRNVGIIKGFVVELQGTVTNTAAAALALSDFNIANMLQQVVFTDLTNNVRINTTGWHLEFVDTVKRGRVFGSSVPTDSPIKYGSNWNVKSAPATIATSGTGTITQKYWVPLAYSNQDLRGAVYAGVVNSTMNLQLTLNTAAAFAATGTDSTLAIYTGNTAATLTSVTVNVYQVFLDQLPIGQRGPVLPILDLSTTYELKNTSFTGITANQEFAMSYANYRDFLSTFVVFYNGTARSTGADVNYLALQSANFLNIFKVDPNLQAMRTRNIMGTDFPPGVYYINHRDKPLATQQYGNLELVLNPLTASASAYCLVGYEDFAMQNTVTQAGSLASS